MAPRVPIAAIQGAKRGALRGKELGGKNALQKNAQLRAQQAQEAEAEEREKQRLEKEQEEFARNILAAHDAHESGTLAKAELKKILSEYAAERFRDQQALSEEDLVFLIKLCDRDGPVGTEVDSVVDRGQVLNVCAALGDYMEQRRQIQDMQKSPSRYLFHAGVHGAIGEEELAVLLKEAAAAEELVEIPPEVVAWIFKTSDVSGSGKLSGIEIARALCAFEAWNGDRTPQAPMGKADVARKVSKLTDGGMPQAKKIQAVASSLCVLQ